MGSGPTTLPPPAAVPGPHDPSHPGGRRAPTAQGAAADLPNTSYGGDRESMEAKTWRGEVISHSQRLVLRDSFTSVA